MLCSLGLGHSHLPLLGGQILNLGLTEDDISISGALEDIRLADDEKDLLKREELQKGGGSEHIRLYICMLYKWWSYTLRLLDCHACYSTNGL